MYVHLGGGTIEQFVSHVILLHASGQVNRRSVAAQEVFSRKGFSQNIIHTTR